MVDEWLRSRGSTATFEEIRGRRERYWKSAPIPLRNHRAEIFIYEDEAGVMVDGTHWMICERPDFDSEEALTEAFLRVLADIAASGPYQGKSKIVGPDGKHGRRRRNR